MLVTSSHSTGNTARWVKLFVGPDTDADYIVLEARPISQQEFEKLPVKVNVMWRPDDDTLKQELDQAVAAAKAAPNASAPAEAK